MSAPSLSSITVVIPALNEEKRIERCLDSVSWASEVIVLLDERTVDQTELKASLFQNVRVEKIVWQGFGQTKNRGLELASNDWILWIDADEVVPEPLAQEIQCVVNCRSEDEAAVAYDLPRLTYFIDGWVRYCGWYPDRVIRLFRKSRCQLDGRVLHEKVEIPAGGRVGHLKEDLLHYSYDDLSQYFAKMLRYGPLGAQAALESGKSCSFYHVVLRPVVSFLRSYLFRLGFLDGKRGFIVCLGSSFSTFMRYSHLYYLKKSESERTSGNGL